MKENRCHKADVEIFGSKFGLGHFGPRDFLLLTSKIDNEFVVLMNSFPPNSDQCSESITSKRLLRNSVGTLIIA